MILMWLSTSHVTLKFVTFVTLNFIKEINVFILINKLVMNGRVTHLTQIDSLV